MPVPIQSNIRLLEVHKYGMEDRISHGNHMLENIILESGSPRPTSRLEPMYGVVVADHRGQPLVNDIGGGFPHDLQFPNPHEVLDNSLVNQHHCMSCKGLYKVPLLERLLRHNDNLSPVGVVHCIIPCRLLEPLVEMI